MRKCGFHVQQVSRELREAIGLVRPMLGVSLHHDLDFWRGVKADFPEMFLIGRLFEIRAGFSSDWRQVDPRRWAEECASLGMPYDAFITRNEPDGINNEITRDDAKRYDEWCCVFRERGLELGFEAVGPNVPAGNWHGQNVVDYLPNLCQQFKYIALHEYSARAMWDQQPALERQPADVPRNEGESVGWWYCGRYRGWKRAICERYPWREGQFKIVVSEGGVAYGVIPDAEGRPKYGDVGWRTDLTEDQYFASLDWYTRELNEDDYCLGWAIFMVGAADPKWNSFETLPLAGRLVSVPEVPVQPGPEPNGGSIMQVFDINRKELFGAEADNLVALHGLTVHPLPQLSKGDVYYELVKLEEREGPACFIFTVLQADGTPWPDQETAWAWPAMGDANDIKTPYPTDHNPEADLGPTNDDGNNGPGFGQTGWYHDPYQPGPGRAWIRHPEHWCRYLTGIGMLGGTNHRTMYGTWQEMIYQGEEPQPDPDGDPVGRLLDIGDEIKTIAHQLGGGAPVGLTLTFSDQSKVEYQLVTKATSGLGRLWAALMGYVTR